MRSIRKSFKIATSAFGASVFALSILATPAHANEMIKVFMNHARILKLDRPISKVIIGNSNVADVTISDNTTVVLTGKSFGTTNLVIFDHDGGLIVDESVLVSIDEGNTVRVYRQIDRSVLSCSPSCEVHDVANDPAVAAPAE